MLNLVVEIVMILLSGMVVSFIRIILKSFHRRIRLSLEFLLKRRRNSSHLVLLLDVALGG